MLSIEKCSIPVNTLLEGYCRNGFYADCYKADIPQQISLNQYVFAFYTTWLFKLERSILIWTVARPSTDAQARQLADGDIAKFAAWQVEGRNENELLMCDFHGRTRSWFMVVPASTNHSTQTRLYFGSAVVPIQNPKTGQQSIGFVFQALLGFHQVYSMLLLYFAKLRLRKNI